MQSPLWHAETSGAGLPGQRQTERKFWLVVERAERHWTRLDKTRACMRPMRADLARLYC